MTAGARRPALSVDSGGPPAYHRAPMSSVPPGRVDVAREVQARRVYEGSLPLGSLRRLVGSLATDEGSVRYRVAFTQDALGASCIELHVEAGLSLVCQRSLEVFKLQLKIDQRLGVIAGETEEASLPADCEPLLAPDGEVSIAEVIEDELILALPVVPLKPGTPLQWIDPASTEPVDDSEADNPFAVLGTLKRH